MTEASQPIPSGREGEALPEVTVVKDIPKSERRARKQTATDTGRTLTDAEAVVRAIVRASGAGEDVVEAIVRASGAGESG